MAGEKTGMPIQANRLIEFDSFLIDLDAAEIKRKGQVVKVEPQVFDLIALLSANPGRVVGHDEVIEKVWQGRIVSDSTIATRINAARKALGDNGTAQKIIKTVRGRGFRLEATPIAGVAAAGGANGVAAAGDRFVLSCTPHGFSLLMTTRGTEGTRQVWRDSLPEALAEAAGRHAALANAKHTAVFARATDALRCAAALHAAIADQNKTLAVAERWTAKIGIGHGSATDNAAYASALRLDAATPPGGIGITGRVMDQVAGHIDLDAEPLAPGTVAGARAVFKVTRIGDTLFDDPGAVHVPQTVGLDIPEPAEVSVVVLPFETIGGDPEVEAVATGLRLEIHSALAQLSGVLPMAAGTAMAFAGSTPPQAAAALGLRYVVQGNVRAIGRRVRLMIELYDRRRGGVAFSRSYDGSLDDGFDFQDQMTARVVAALDVKVLSGEQARVWHNSFRSLKAIRIQYRGMGEFFKMTKEAMRAARECFEQLHMLHPDISIGSTWISLCHWFELQRGWTSDPDVSILAVKKWSAIAIAKDDADGQAHTALCHVHLMERAFDQALEIGEAAITVRPSCAHANGFFAHALYYCGSLDKAVHHAKMAIRFSPAYPPLFAVVLSGAYHAQGDQDAAIAIAKEVMRLPGRDPLPGVILTSALMEADRPLEAHALALEMREFGGRFEIDPFLAPMPFRRHDMREQLSRNFAHALEDTP